MPAFDLRGIKAAKYVKTGTTVTYTGGMAVGDAMTANLELKYAEGRLYAESALKEYLKVPTGGSISFGVKYLAPAVQQLLCGVTTNTDGGVDMKATGTPEYVGVGFYAPDMIDGVEKYSAVFVAKALFGPPSMSYQTKGENIQFGTPTITGEFLADDADETLVKTGVFTTAAAAETWVKTKLNIT